MEKRVFDCFRFFNEKELLELRYHMLKDHVHQFVIMQGTKTQSGIETPLLAEKYIQELGLPDDRFIVLNTSLPGNQDAIERQEEDFIARSMCGASSDSEENAINARSRERLLLDSLLSVTTNSEERDVFLVSDCDEIIRPDYVNWFTDKALEYHDFLIRVPLVELQGRADLRAYDAYTNQPGSTDRVFYIATKKHFEKCSPFRLRFEINCPFPTTYLTLDGFRVEDCGWHFSWMGDSSIRKLKNKSTSHYADIIEHCVVSKMASEELQDYMESWEAKEDSPSPWGDTRILLKDYPKSFLPPAVFQLERVEEFLLGRPVYNQFITEDKVEGGSVERTDIINFLIEKIGAKSYLEIGVCTGWNFSQVLCSRKVGVDPNPNSPATYHLTSDEFFSANKETFDIIFIDGLHHADQVYRDILNSLDVLNDGGYIVCHNMNPEIEEYQVVPYNKKMFFWTGDCWKAFVKLRSERSDLEMIVVDTDFGCGVIRKGHQDLLHVDRDLTYQNLCTNREKWLSLVSVKEFLRKYSKSLSPEGKIPVIGVPIVNGVHWLRRLLASVDYPVKDFFIVNNNGRGEIDAELEDICKDEYPFIEKIKVCHLPGNIGVAGAWNLVIKSYLMEPYWIICNNDFAFTSGFLREMVQKGQVKEYDFVAPPNFDGFTRCHGIGSFECFLLKDSAVQKCGLFDENLYPAYCEDCDYIARIKQLGLKFGFVDSPFYHGEGQSYETGSQTKKLESAEVADKAGDAHILNSRYLEGKWGSDWQDWGGYESKRDRFTHRPYDLNFNKRKYLGF